MIHYTDYRDPQLRDLAWALASPPLLQRSDQGVYWPDRDWYAEIGNSYGPRLRQLDARPQALHKSLATRHDRRLGSYFESLWRFWLEDAGRFRLLHANLPLRNRDRTLGEFDFLVMDTHTGKTLHWELAVKFYLGCNDTTQPENWWGPARRDRLDIKTQRLIEHQARLSQYPEAHRLLDQLGLRIDGTWLIVKGRLFYPRACVSPPPVGAHPDHLKGFWLRQSCFDNRDRSHWLVLDRHRWLAPLAGDDAKDCVTAAKLADQWEHRPLQHPLCIARISAGTEVERGFVVPDDWG